MKITIEFRSPLPGLRLVLHEWRRKREPCRKCGRRTKKRQIAMGGMMAVVFPWCYRHTRAEAAEARCEVLTRAIADNEDSLAKLRNAAGG